MNSLRGILSTFLTFLMLSNAHHVCSNDHLQVDVYHESETTVHYQGKSDLLYSPTTYTLIHSAHEAILVDAPTLLSDGTLLAQWIKEVAPGKNLKYIYITHAHADHFNSFPAVLEAFPNAKVVATQGVIAHLSAQYEYPLWDVFWKGLFPAIEKADLSLFNTLPASGKFFLENGKHELQAIEVGEGDTADSTVLYVPDIDLVVGGDVVYGHCYQYLAENPTPELRRDWIASLEKITTLAPRWVIPSHMQAGEKFGVEHLFETKAYIETWDTWLKIAKTWEELEGLAMKKYPYRVGTFILRYTAQSFFNATF